MKNWVAEGVASDSHDTTSIQTLSSEGIDFNNLYYVYNKTSNFNNPSLPQIEMIDIGHKSLTIIIGPYVGEQQCLLQYAMSGLMITK